MKGKLLGWNMILWGSSIDPNKAMKYEVPLVEDLLPPLPVHPGPVVIPTPPISTKQHPKPTQHLPGDHGIAGGENTEPAFATPTGTPDVGWFSDLGKLVTNQKWFFGALGAVTLFGISASIFLWRRRIGRLANYTSLSNRDNDVDMTALGSSMSGQRTTRELYDAFGEVSEDDDDDETTALRQPVGQSVGFHSGFLEDDEPSATTLIYHDAPEETEENLNPPSDREESASSTGSGDGSWEHASRD